MGPRGAAGQGFGTHLFRYIEMQLHLSKTPGSAHAGGLGVHSARTAGPGLSGPCSLLGSYLTPAGVHTGSGSGHHSGKC